MREESEEGGREGRMGGREEGRNEGREGGRKEELMWSILIYEQTSWVKSCNTDNDMHVHSSHTTFFRWCTHW